MKNIGTLYLIPSSLGAEVNPALFPAFNMEIIDKLDHFICENARTTRRFMSQLNLSRPIQDRTFVELQKHAKRQDMTALLAPLFEGNDVGLVSEAGVPAVADPGSAIVMAAHNRHISVVPLIGASSILLALMASGLSGQNFSFCGYLPVKTDERIEHIKFLESRSQTEKQTQIFIETPYRNEQLLTDILKTCSDQTHLCIAADLTLPNEFIKTQRVIEWQKKVPKLHKRPAIFLILKE